MIKSSTSHWCNFILHVAFVSSIVNFGEPTLSLGVPNMDTNAPGTSSYPHVNDTDNSDINIDNENTNILLRMISMS